MRLSPRARRRGLLAVALAVPLVAAGVATWLGRPVPLEPYRGPMDRLVVHDRPSFWAGVNYPWKTGQDFGTGGWGHSGVSDATTYQEVDVDFANMAAQGVRVVKWRVFNDGRYSPEFDADGRVTGLDERFFPDLDAALEIATRHDIYLVLTLFSSGFWTADCTSSDVRLGGHAATLQDARKRRTLIDNAIVPLLEHLARSDRVLGYEVIAEPEWGVQELHQEEDARIRVPLSVVRDFVQEAVRAVHLHTRALATVESNRFTNMHAWQGLGLDYYSYSWYDWLEPYEPLAMPAASAGLDRPVVLGEFPAGGSTYYNLPDVFDLALANGSAGAFAWSYWSGDGLSRWREVGPGFTDWTRQHWDTVDIGDAALPADGPIAEQRYPYTFSDLAVRLDGDTVVAEMKIDVASGEPYVPHGYLYQVGNAQPLEDVRLTAAEGQPGRLAARFTQVQPDTAYSVSLGIFNRADALRKWFGNVATFTVQNGLLAAPKIDTLAAELGCGGS